MSEPICAPSIDWVANLVSNPLTICRGLVSSKQYLRIRQLCHSLRHKFGWLYSSLVLCKARKECA